MTLDFSNSNVTCIFFPELTPRPIIKLALRVINLYLEWVDISIVKVTISLMKKVTW